MTPKQYRKALEVAIETLRLAPGVAPRLPDEVKHNIEHAAQFAEQALVGLEADRLTKAIYASAAVYGPRQMDRLLQRHRESVSARA